jgi:RNA polymerase sigma-70 factor (ECF subfamily)
MTHDNPKPGGSFFNDCDPAQVINCMENGSHCTAVMDSALLMSRLQARDLPPETIDIPVLVRRTLAGDATAFEQLIIRYERRIFALAMKLLGSTDDAQDAAQEVFLRMFKYIHRFDIHKPIEPWLMQMTVNVCRNIGRNRQRRWDTFPATVDSEVAIANECRDPHSGLAEEQQRQMLWRALDTLPAKERLAVILRDIDGMTTAEVAQILGSSETTVRSQVSRARVRMKEAIDQMMGGRS